VIAPSHSFLVTTGLDPVVHAALSARENLPGSMQQLSMDCRIKSGNDERPSQRDSARPCFPVTTGLDPVVHAALSARENLPGSMQHLSMDCRIKSGNDEMERLAL